MLSRIRLIRTGFFLLWDIAVAIGGAVAAVLLLAGYVDRDPAIIALVAAAVGVGSLRRAGRDPPGGGSPGETAAG